MQSGKQKGRWGELFVQVFHSLFNHPKTLDFASRLGNPPLAWAHLVLIWAWAQRCATAGRFKVDAAQISKIAEWTGDPSVFLAALLDSGFFEKSGEKFRIHDWEQHSGAINIKRRKDIERHRIQGTSTEDPRQDVDVDVDVDGDVDRDGKTEQITSTDHPPSAPPGKPAGELFQTEPPKPRGRKPSSRPDERAWKIVKKWIASWVWWGQGAVPAEWKRKGKCYDSVMELLANNSEEDILKNAERYIRTAFRSRKAGFCSFDNFKKTFGDWNVYPMDGLKVFCEGEWGRPDCQGSFQFPILWKDGATVDYRAANGEDVIITRSQFEREEQAKRGGAP